MSGVSRAGPLLAVFVTRRPRATFASGPAVAYYSSLMSPMDLIAIQTFQRTKTASPKKIKNCQKVIITPKWGAAGRRTISGRLQIIVITGKSDDFVAGA